MKTRRIVSLIVTIAMLFSMLGQSFAMAEEQLILDNIEMSAQQEDNSDVINLDNAGELDINDPMVEDDSLDITSDLGDLVTGLVGEEAPHTVRNCAKIIKSFEARWCSSNQGGIHHQLCSLRPVHRQRL